MIWTATVSVSWLSVDEVRACGEFIGSTRSDEVDDGMAFTGVEVGWRLSFVGVEARGATEAAIVALEHGFATVGLPEILAVMTKTSLRSQAVMRRIVMTFDPAEHFDDQDVEEGLLRSAGSTGSYRTPDAQMQGEERRWWEPRQYCRPRLHRNQPNVMLG